MMMWPSESVHQYQQREERLLARLHIDIQQKKVDLVNAGTNYIGDVVDADLRELVSSGMLRATSDFSCKALGWNPGLRGC